MYLVNMKKILTILILLLAISTTKAQKPNLVIIHTDEHNFRTLSCYRENLPEEQAYVWGKGLGVHTVNIDRIAKEGAICMNYYAASPVCAPSRGSMVTGLYRQAHGVVKNELPINKNVKTIGHILSDNGYATSYVGKWHLGDERQKYKFTETYKGGFQDNEFMMNKGHSPYFVLKNGKVVKAINQKKKKSGSKEQVIHMTDFFVDKTIDVINRDKNKPFCVMVSIPDPHTPDHAKAPYDKMYDHMDLKMPKTMESKNLENRPEWAHGGKNDIYDKNRQEKAKMKFNAKKLRQYFGMVKHIDDRVGDILKTLEVNGLTNNTIVVFTSDHGDMFYEHGKMNKGNAYEASAKIPFVIKYPKKIKKGKILKRAYNNIDFVPTMLGLMGVKTEVEFHGKDTSLDLLSGAKLVESEEYIHIAEANNLWVSLINNKYKLILYSKHAPTLFDLKKDPHEMVNCFNQKGYKDLSKKMVKILKSRMKKFDEPAYKKGLRYQ